MIVENDADFGLGRLACIQPFQVGHEFTTCDAGRTMVCVNVPRDQTQACHQGNGPIAFVFIVTIPCWDAVQAPAVVSAAVLPIARMPGFSSYEIYAVSGASDGLFLFLDNLNLLVDEQHLSLLVVKFGITLFQVIAQPYAVGCRVSISCWTTPTYAPSLRLADRRVLRARRQGQCDLLRQHTKPARIPGRGRCGTTTTAPIFTIR